MSELASAVLPFLAVVVVALLLSWAAVAFGSWTGTVNRRLRELERKMSQLEPPEGL